MFGPFYEVRDQQVAGRRGEQATSRGRYARELLAELLDRAEVVEAAWWGLYHAAHSDGLGRTEATHGLIRAVEMFLKDADEARTRGLRARLFARDEVAGLNHEVVHSRDTLEDLGGELVSAERALTDHA